MKDEDSSSNEMSNVIFKKVCSDISVLSQFSMSESAPERKYWPNKHFRLVKRSFKGHCLWRVSIYVSFALQSNIVNTVLKKWLYWNQSSYMSRISRIIFMGKKLSCGEISAFHVWQLWGNWKFLYMWRNFRCLHMKYVQKYEILRIWHVCDVENVVIYAKLMQFLLFCR